MKNIKSKEDLIRLGFFSLALSNGLIDKSEVIKWADKILSETPNPDYVIIELSLLGNTNVKEIISILNKYIEGNPHKTSARIVLGMLYKLYNNEQIPLKKALKIFSSLYQDSNLTEYEKNILDRFDFLYELAENEILGSFKEVKKYLSLFLEIYKEFNIDDRNNWEILNKSIEEKFKNGFFQPVFSEYGLGFLIEHEANRFE